MTDKPIPSVVMPLSTFNSLIKTLEFYELHGRNCRKNTSEGAESRAALDRDGGKLAKTQLRTMLDQPDQSIAGNYLFPHLFSFLTRLLDVSKTKFPERSDEELYHIFLYVRQYYSDDYLEILNTWASDISDEQIQRSVTEKWEAFDDLPAFEDLLSSTAKDLVDHFLDMAHEP